nr:ABC transporter ATP-binding protein [Lachnospiraceae bacterium]
IVTRVTNDVESLNQMYTQVLVRLISNTVLIIGYAVVMISINPRLALISFLFLPVVFAFTLTFRILIRKIYRIVRTKISALNTFLSENISGMKLIQLFAREGKKAEEFGERTTDLYNTQMKEMAIFGMFRPGLSFIANFAYALIIYRSGVSVLEGALTLGTLYIFTNYIRSFFEPIQELAEQFSTLQNAMASAEKIFTILDEKNTIPEPEEPVRMPEFKGRIEFRNVWFAYENEDWVLKDVSFVIRPGERVAFVGATGAGKSSILNLIGRYYDIQKGEILIDDVNIKDLSLADLRRAIGQVQQDVFVFTGDIKSNIRLLSEEITDEEIRAAAHASNADHFIAKLPAGYDEPVTERGSTLSAGERQLLSFARTLAFDPKILVLDEATANIDTETEQLIQAALETLMQGRTSIVVAHRLSTIQHADEILVMHKGRIRERGSHQELLALNGIYKKLYELQAQ